MIVKVKKTLSYVTIHTFMFISGLEYAIIFPTLWDYLQHLGVPQGETFWLGLTISAMTTTDILTGLLAGRLADTWPFIRCMVLLLNCFQMLGASLYLTATSPLLLVISRLVSGCGKCITVVFLADICKSTEKKERTPILLLFNIASQVGLLLGPALNLVIQHLEIRTEFLTVTKLNAPGLFMLVLWTFFSGLVFFAYNDLISLRCEEVISRHMEVGYHQDDSLPRHTILDQSLAEDHSGESGVFEEDEEGEGRGSAAGSGGGQRDEERGMAGTSRIKEVSRDSEAASAAIREYKARLESVRSERNLQILSSERDSYGSISTRVGDEPGSTLDKQPTMVRRKVSRISDKFIREADRLMGSEADRSNSTTNYSLYSSLETSRAPPPPPLWRLYKEALLRDEIIVLIFLRFIAMFCQASMEAIIPPLMSTYFLFDDMANSYLYLVAGVELMVMFGILTVLSRCVSDRSLIAWGLVFLLISLAWHSLTLPFFNKGDQKNVIYFGVGIFIELAGIPIVCDIGLALYSKLLPDNIQGFCHGFRRFITQLAILLGPLWGTSTLSHPFFLTGLPFAMIVIGCVLYLVSFRKMVPEEFSSLLLDETGLEEEGEENDDPVNPTERTPLLT